MTGWFRRTAWLIGGMAVIATTGWAAEPAVDAATQTAEEKPAQDSGLQTAEQLAQTAGKSVVVVTVTGRDGKQSGLGSGFVVTADGLIATNMHVISEGRPITVQLADGKKYDVKAIHAFDRPLDLALIKIDASNLTPLPLGDSSALKQGQPVVAIGNPHGLKLSVVTGVVSGTREIEGREMIQLAIPIEVGNSGGPLIDMRGRVQGLLTMKSAITQNLGFAMPVNALKMLIAKPNPTPIARWLTIGALDPREWTPLFGANWRQRAGRILVDGMGNGFGGRSICLAKLEVPETPFELGVSVKLDREEGAAGLVFCADGGEVHYGFYPSNGNLRLSRFDGADVFSWHVLAEVKSERYRPGDWNALKVRFEKGKILCYVNDLLAIESNDARLASGKVGLAKFRATEAQFRSFRVGKNLGEIRPDGDMLANMRRTIDELPADWNNLSAAAEKFSDSRAGVAALRERVQQLERQSQQFKKLAQQVHQRRVEKELSTLFGQRDDAEIDLFHAGLLVALLDNEEVDVDGYRAELERMAREVRQSLAPESDESARLAALNQYLFEEQGFHGSRGEFYHRSNSYLNEVLDDREGLPITLSVIYIELARRLDLRVVGLALPGHFVVRYEPMQGESKIIDVFERGKVLSQQQAETIIGEAEGRPAIADDLAPASKQTIIVRMLRNLQSIETNPRNVDGLLRYQGAIVAVNSKSGEERFRRGVFLLEAGRHAEAQVDCDWLFENRPADVNLNQVDEFRRVLERVNRK